MAKREKRVALVTGANKGIGFEVARQLARKGFHVFIGARDPEAGKAAAEKLNKEMGNGGSDLVTGHTSLVTLYEAADPSYMAVGAAIRYWKKYHPDSLAGRS